MQEHGGETILPFSCAFEQKLVDMPEDEAAKYCAENQLTRQVNLVMFETVAWSCQMLVVM